MRRFLKLYLVEQRKIYLALIFLMLMYSCVYLFLQFGNSRGNPGFLLLLLTFGTTYAAPIIFGFLLNDELKFNTSYQLFALPYERYKLLLSKFLATMVIYIVTIFGFSLCLKLWQKLGHQNDAYVDYHERLLITYMYVFWFFGITCLTAAVVLSIRRYRQVTGVIFFISLMTLSIKFHNFTERIIKHKIDWLRWNITYDGFRVMFLIGLFFVVLGHYIYHKFSEI